MLNPSLKSALERVRFATASIDAAGEVLALCGELLESSPEHLKAIQWILVQVRSSMECELDELHINLNRLSDD